MMEEEEYPVVKLEDLQRYAKCFAISFFTAIYDEGNWESKSFLTDILTISKKLFPVVDIPVYLILRFVEKQKAADKSRIKNLMHPKLRDNEMALIKCAWQIFGMLEYQFMSIDEENYENEMKNIGKNSAKRIFEYVKTSKNIKYSNEDLTSYFMKAFVQGNSSQIIVKTGRLRSSLNEWTVPRKISTLGRITLKKDGAPAKYYYNRENLSINANSLDFRLVLNEEQNDMEEIKENEKIQIKYKYKWFQTDFDSFVEEILGSLERNAEILSIVKRISEKQKFIIPLNYKSNLFFTGPFTNIQTISTCFGRENELVDLRKRIEENVIVNLHGLSGIGKSELARKLGESMFNRGWNTLWIKAETYESFEKSFSKIKELISDESEIYISDLPTNIGKTVKDVFKRYAHVHSIFIFDGVQDYNIIENFLQNCETKNIKILITSVDPIFKDAKSMILNEFNQKDAVTYVKKCLQSEENIVDEDVEKFISKTGKFPLTLKLLMTHIEEDQKRKKILNPKVKLNLNEYADEFELSNSDDAVSKHFKPLLETIKKHKGGMDAFKLISKMAYLYHDNIDMNLFLPDFNNAVSLIEAVLLLQKFHILSDDNNVYKPIQDTLREIINHEINDEEKEITHKANYDGKDVLSVENDEDGDNLRKANENEKKILRELINLFEKYVSKGNIDEVLNSIKLHIVTVWKYASAHEDLIQDYIVNAEKFRITYLHLIAECAQSMTFDKIMKHIELQGGAKIVGQILEINHITDGRTIFQSALLGKSQQIQKRLDQYKTTLSIYTTADHNGHTYLHSASINEDENVYGDLKKLRISVYETDGPSEIDDKSRRSILIECISKITKNKQRLPLHYAAYYGNIKMVQALLENKADITAVDGNKQTALHLAVLGSSTACVEELLRVIKHRSVIDAKDFNGDTALHIAARHEDWESISCLIRGGITTNVKNSNGQMAVDLNDSRVKPLLEEPQNPNPKSIEPKYMR